MRVFNSYMHFKTSFIRLCYIFMGKSFNKKSAELTKRKLHNIYKYMLNVCEVYHICTYTVRLLLLSSMVDCAHLYLKPMCAAKNIHIYLAIIRGIYTRYFSQHFYLFQSVCGSKFVDQASILFRCASISGSAYT